MNEPPDSSDIVGSTVAGLQQTSARNCQKSDARWQFGAEVTSVRAGECLAAIPDTLDLRPARELTALIKRGGKPGMIVSDNGTEFTSNAMFAWAQDTPGSPGC